MPPRHDIAPTTTGHPATTLGYRGTHPDACLNFAFDIRCERPIVFATEPNSPPIHAGGSHGSATPNALASASKYARRRTGSSSPTLYVPDGTFNAATTADAASSRWIDDTKSSCFPNVAATRFRA